MQATSNKKVYKQYACMHVGMCVYEKRKYESASAAALQSHCNTFFSSS